MDTSEFCRAIEAYLCRKNDGHLVRVVGPSFDLVSGWAAQGIPLKVACAGIDRHFERYYRDRRPRRRPVRIDFCDADVRDAFDEWRRAVLLTAGDRDGSPEAPAVETAARSGPSLPTHLERVLLRLTAARAGGSLGSAFDDLIDRVAHDLDAVRAAAGGLRGKSRRALIAQLALLDEELLQMARLQLDELERTALVREAELELTAYREHMAPEAFARSREAVADRLLRERLGLPTIAYV